MPNRIFRPAWLVATITASTSIAGLAPSTSARSAPPPAAERPCDRACLVGAMTAFHAAMSGGRSDAVPLATGAEVRENAKLARLADTLWSRVRTIRSVLIFADPLTGNVVGRAGVELKDGKAAYISTRLKLLDARRIGDVEIESDSSDHVVPTYVWNLDHGMEEPLPAAQRTDRVAMDALIHRYFDALASHRPDPADFDDAVCNRFHSGQQITNVVANRVETGGRRTCVSSNQGDPPWGPATEQRVPVIDEERGIAVGMMLLHYLREPGQPTMYVQEVYKIVKGRIVKIDNIALKGPHLATTGFVH